MSLIGDLFSKSFGRAKGNSQGLFSSRSSLPALDKGWNSSDFLQASHISLYTHKAIEKRAEKVGQVKFLLKKGDKVIENHPMLDLLYKPNAFFTGSEFWELFQKYKDIVGAAYILKVGQTELFEKNTKVTELHLLRPDLVTFELDPKTGEIEEFIYQKGTKNEVKYSKHEIIYSFRPNPLDPLRGLSLLASGIRAIQTENEISEYHARVLKNGGKVEGVFNFKSSNALTGTQLVELKDSYQKQYAGTKKSGMPLFLGGDVSYHNIGLNPSELSYLEAKRVTLSDICILTGVPKPMLGSLDDIKFDNAESARRTFLRETIKPLLMNLTSKLDLGLIPDDLDLSFEDPTPEDVEAKLKTIETAHTVNALTTNEKRELLGFEPIKNGDEVLVPFNLIPMDQPKVEAPKAEKGAFKDAGHPLHDKDIRDKYAELHIKKSDRREEGFVKKLDTYLDEQEVRVIAHLQDAKRFKYKGIIDEVFNPELEISIAKEKFLPVLEEVLREAGVDAMSMAGSSYSFNLTSNIRSWLDQKVAVFARHITDTTRNQLKDAFSDSIAAGENRNQLVNRIQNVYVDIKKGRAETIARTEIAGATQNGTMQGYKQAAVPIKIWVAVRDSRTRDSHSYLDGQERPLDMPFGNGLMYPGDPNGAAEEVINCRCSI